MNRSTEPGPESEAWRSRAKCNTGDGTLVGIFFSDDVVDLARAKNYCRECPVSRDCLDFAMKTEEDFGVWGGKDESERRTNLRPSSTTRTTTN